MLLEKCLITGCTPSEYLNKANDAEDYFLTCALIKKYEAK